MRPRLSRHNSIDHHHEICTCTCAITRQFRLWVQCVSGLGRVGVQSTSKMHDALRVGHRQPLVAVPRCPRVEPCCDTHTHVQGLPNRKVGCSEAEPLPNAAVWVFCDVYLDRYSRGRHEDDPTAAQTWPDSWMHSLCWAFDDCRLDEFRTFHFCTASHHHCPPLISTSGFDISATPTGGQRRLRHSR
jgi:hypothetical protein